MQNPTTIKQTSPENELAATLVNRKVASFNPFRRDRIVEWRINMAYLTGHQWLVLDEGRLAEDVNAPPHAVTANKIQSGVINDIAVAGKNAPVFDVIPTGTDQDDIATAIAGQKMLQYIRRRNAFDQGRVVLVTWVDIANIAWRKNYWNPQHHVRGTNPEPEQPGHNPEMPPGAVIYEGEAVSEPVPTNEVIWDWRCDPTKLSWIIHAKQKTIAEVRAKYGQEMLDFIPSTEIQNAATQENNFEIAVRKELTQRFGGAVRPEADQLLADDKTVNYYEFWQVRDGVYPQGMYVEMAGGVVMVNRPYPIEEYPHGEVPMVAYAPLLFDLSNAGTASRISQARPLQRELNWLRTLILDNTETLGNGIWLVHDEDTLNFSRVTNQCGIEVRWSGRRPPERQPGISVAAGLYAHLLQIEADIEEVFAFHAVSKGKNPKGGPRSGVGLNLLHEADLTQLHPIIAAFEAADERSMNQLLQIAFSPNTYKERTFSIVGKDNEWTLFAFNREELKGQACVRIQAGSSMPTSKSIEREMVAGLVQLGMINIMDPVQKRKALQVLDIGGLDSILKDDGKDVNYARKEFLIAEKMYLDSGGLQPGMTDEQMAGILVVPQPNIFDNHEVHVVEHRMHLVDKFFEYIGSGDPGLQSLAQAMQDHWLIHTQILAQQMMMQAAMTGQIEPGAEEEKSSGETSE